MPKLRSFESPEPCPFRDCKDCFGRMDGKALCTVLTNTKGMSKCRFYKSQEEYEKGLRK